METACQEFVKQQMTSPQQIPDASESVEDQPMNIEIIETPITPKHHSKGVVQQKEPIRTFQLKPLLLRLKVNKSVYHILIWLNRT